MIQKNITAKSVSSLRLSSDTTHNAYYDLFEDQVRQVFNDPTCNAMLLGVNAEYPLSISYRKAKEKYSHIQDVPISNALDHAVGIARVENNFLFFDPNEGKTYIYTDLNNLLI